MPEETPRVGLKKPLGSDNVKRDLYNENMEILEAKVALDDQTLAAAGEAAPADATGLVGKLSNWLGRILNRIVAITGEPDYRTAPAINLKTVGSRLGQAVNTTSSPSFTAVTSTVADGTAPLNVTSKTKVPNLNVEQVDGFHANATPTASTIPVRDTNKNLLVDRLRTTLGHNPNLLFNPSWRQNTAGWSGINTNGFSISTGGYGEGGYLECHTSTGAANVQVTGLKVPTSPGAKILVSADMFTSGATAGEIRLQIDAFDAAGASLGGAAVAMLYGQTWTKQSTEPWVTPANTASVTVSCIVMANTTLSAGGLVAWRNIKLEGGDYPTAFSDDMIGATRFYPGSIWNDYTTTQRSYVHRQHNTSQTLTAGAWNKINYTGTLFDHLGESDVNGKVTLKQSGVYTIVAALMLTTTVPAQADSFQLKLYINGGQDRQLGKFGYNGASYPFVNGSISIRLNAGDTIEVYAMPGAPAVATQPDTLTSYFTVLKTA